jgi:hypothetical protein
MFGCLTLLLWLWRALAAELPHAPAAASKQTHHMAAERQQGRQAGEGGPHRATGFMGCVQTPMRLRASAPLLWVF